MISVPNGLGVEIIGFGCDFLGVDLADTAIILERVVFALNCYFVNNDESSIFNSVEH